MGVLRGQNQIPSCFLSVMLSPPKPLDEIQPNSVCELLTRMGAQRLKNYLAPPPGALGRGEKVKYHLISITKSISKIFIPNFMCVLTNERYKHIRQVFILSPGSCPRGGTLGYLGAKIKFLPAVCPLCYLLIYHWTKFIQIWCVSYSHEYPWGPGEGQKVKYHLISKILIPNFVCVLTNERYKASDRIFILLL